MNLRAARVKYPSSEQKAMIYANEYGCGGDFQCLLYQVNKREQASQKLFSRVMCNRKQGADLALLAGDEPIEGVESVVFACGYA